jgi:hypothetical protein
LERALFESALRVDLAGGVERLAEAVAAGASEVDAARIVRLVGAFGPKGLAAERRLGSLALALDLPLVLESKVAPRQPVIRLDPREDRVEWIDSTFRVAWSNSVNELRAVIEN